jgi:outer membrane usher protein FimD/PapC
VVLNLDDDVSKPLPFGARVRATNGKEIGRIGSAGQGFVAGTGRPAIC